MAEAAILEWSIISHYEDAGVLCGRVSLMHMDGGSRIGPPLGPVKSHVYTKISTHFRSHRISGFNPPPGFNPPREVDLNLDCN